MIKPQTFTGCIFLLVFISTLAAGLIQPRGHSDSQSYKRDLTEALKYKLPPRPRIITSALLKGFKAVTDLVKRATHVPSDGKINEYLKYGDYKNAVEDFFSVRPFDVKRVKFMNGAVGMRGRVGDRTIVIKSKDKDGKVVMEILKSYISQSGYLKAVRTEKIVYSELK